MRRWQQSEVSDVRVKSRKRCVERIGDNTIFLCHLEWCKRHCRFFGHHGRTDFPANRRLIRLASFSSLAPPRHKLTAATLWCRRTRTPPAFASRTDETAFSWLADVVSVTMWLTKQGILLGVSEEELLPSKCKYKVMQVNLPTMRTWQQSGNFTRSIAVLKTIFRCRSGDIFWCTLRHIY